MSAMRLLALFAYFLPIALAQLPCYFPNGALSSDRPCNLTAEVSTCCEPTYACLSNNICAATSLTTRLPGATNYVRGSCTDSTWKSTSCPRFCLDPQYDNLAGGEGIIRCPNAQLDEYYCFDRSPSNCTTHQNVLIFQGSPSYIYNPAITYSTSVTSTVPSTLLPIISTPGSTSTLVPSPVSASLSTDAPSASATPSPTQSPSTSSHAVPIGVGVGVPLGVIALAGLGYLAYRSGKASNKSPGASDLPTHTTSPTPVYSFAEAEKRYTDSSEGPHDFETVSSGRHELMEQPQRYELSAIAE